ncbi:MAG: hypothetical protein DRI57_01950 [Deltaproteobacteria bacterium]|nr:MAG: hypothetical protein DRI57_01950 [Deltaproteobacteria bacterium]
MCISDQKGSVLIAVAVTITLIAVLSAGVVSMNKTSIHSGIHANSFHKAQYVAESGIRFAKTSGATSGTYTLSNGDQFKLVISDCEVTSSAIIHGGTAFETIKNMSAALPSPDSPIPPVTNGLVSYWSFDDPCDQGRDDYGNNNGTINSATKEADGQVGHAMEFDANSEFVGVGDAPDLRITGELTLAAWVKETTQKTYGKIISRRNGSYFYFLGVDRGNPYGGIGNGSSYTVTGKKVSLPSDEWHHIAFSYHDGDDKMHIYYDSVLKETVSVMKILPATEGVDVSIGADSEGTAAFFRGIVDEVFVYNRALSLNEIRDIYNVPCVSELYYPLEGNANDQSGNGNDGIKHGDVAYVPSEVYVEDVLEQAASFDGSGDYILVSDSCLKYTGKITLMAWVKESNRKQYAKIISRRDGDSFCFLGIDNGIPYGGIGDDLLALIPVVTDKSAISAMPLDEWHHLAVTYSETDTVMNLYYDGVLTVATTMAETLPGQTVDLSIGADSRGTAAFFHGSIDEVYVYDKALTATDIQTYYNLTKP